MTKSDVLNHFGTQQAIADALGIYQSSVAEWTERIPALRQIQIERITLGALRADPECWPQSPRTNQAAA